MPAQSQQQQKLFGLALAFKRGEVPASEVSDEIKDIADRMSEKEIEDFASTKHKGLPKMKEQLRKIVREIMRERAISEIELSKDDMEKLHSDGEVEVDGEKVTFEEGKKRFRQQDGIGKAKYTISYHDGKQKHKDGSDFFGIQIFKNKKDLETFRNALLKKGYIEESINEAYDFKPNKNMNNLMKGRKIKNVVYSDKLGFAIILDNGKFVLIRGHRATPGSEKELELESVNEARVSIEAASVANLTGTRNLAVQDFIDAHNLDARKLYKHIKSGSLKDRMEFVTALAGKPGNPIQTKVIKMFGESVVNEGYSTEEKRIVMMAVRKLAKYRNVPINQSINDLLGAGQELERDIKKGKITK
jgi:hypothetical protein